MWMLGAKDGKPWWQKQNDQGNWVPVTEEEAAAYRKYWTDKRAEIAASILDKMFNKEKSK
jgi:hypothetical protein